MIPGCVTSDRSGWEVHFSHILSTFLRSIASVSVVDYGVDIHDMFGCLFSNSAFSADGVYCTPYFVQTVLELPVVATSQTTQRHLLFP